MTDVDTGYTLPNIADRGEVEPSIAAKVRKVGSVGVYFSEIPDAEGSESAMDEGSGQLPKAFIDSCFMGCKGLNKLNPAHAEVLIDEMLKAVGVTVSEHQVMLKMVFELFFKGFKYGDIAAQMKMKNIPATAKTVEQAIGLVGDLLGKLDLLAKQAIVDKVLEDYVKATAAKTPVAVNPMTVRQKTLTFTPPKRKGGAAAPRQVSRPALVIVANESPKPASRPTRAPIANVKPPKAEVNFANIGDHAGNQVLARAKLNSWGEEEIASLKALIDYSQVIGDEADSQLARNKLRGLMHYLPKPPENKPESVIRYVMLADLLDETQDFGTIAKLRAKYDAITEENQMLRVRIELARVITKLFNEVAKPKKVKV